MLFENIDGSATNIKNFKFLRHIRYKHTDEHTTRGYKDYLR